MLVWWVEDWVSFLLMPGECASSAISPSVGQKSALAQLSAPASARGVR
jgi:hypothetical protein